MIYVPSYSSSNCVSIRSGDVIRVYATTPTSNSTINYVDYYINSHYISLEGTQIFSNYATLPTCVSSAEVTTDFYYRNDLADIMIIFFIICVFAFYIPFKVFTRIFRRLR